MRVYKFLSAKYGLEALEKRRLKIARINELNDPFELLGTNLSDRQLRKAFGEMKNALNANRGLLCFSKRWRNPVLWSHYAEGHRGLCLGFDVPDHLLMHVKYTRKRVRSDKLLSLDQPAREREITRLLSTKFSHWRYENEARCFVILENKDQDSGHYFYTFSDYMKLRQILVGAISSVSRYDVEKALGTENAHVERIKTRAAFQTFNVVRNRKAVAGMTEQESDVLIEAEYQGRRCFIINRDYWHLTHGGGMLPHNVLLAKGFSFSISAVNVMENMEGAVTQYGAGALFADKERAWERIRKAEFPNLPTRINALFLFESKELAQQATAEWFGNDNRLLVRAQLVDGSRTFRADAKWLNGATADNAEDRARRYWSGEMSPDPFPEIIVCGLVYFPDWEQWGELMTFSC
jgi:Protein of unknown function (DUF2971)